MIPSRHLSVDLPFQVASSNPLPTSMMIIQCMSTAHPGEILTTIGEDTIMAQALPIAPFPTMAILIIMPLLLHTVMDRRRHRRRLLIMVPGIIILIIILIMACTLHTHHIHIILLIHLLTTILTIA